MKGENKSDPQGNDILTKPEQMVTGGERSGLGRGKLSSRST